MKDRNREAGYLTDGQAFTYGDGGGKRPDPGGIDDRKMNDRKMGKGFHKGNGDEGGPGRRWGMG